MALVVTVKSECNFLCVTYMIISTVIVCVWISKRVASVRLVMANPSKLGPVDCS